MVEYSVKTLASWFKLFSKKSNMETRLLSEVKTADAMRSSPPLLLLCLVAQLHGIAADVDTLAHQLALTSETPQDFDLLELAASKLGLKARQESIAVERLQLTPLPALARLQNGQWAIVAAANTTHVVLQHAKIGNDLSAERTQDNQPVKLTLDEFAHAWLGTNESGTPLATKGQMLLLASRASLIGELSKFDFSWFIPSLVRYRRLLAEVLGTSVVLQLFALVTPLFFQVVMDKVLVHQGISTLNVLVIGLIAISIFESALSFLRIYVFSHTTSRIDVELGSRLFRHLLRLPLNWFQARRVGDSVARVRELENIRSFLTGQALTVVLDVMFSIIFIAVMLAYSGILTLIVLLSIPCYVAVTVMIVPVLRQRLNEKFARGAENQALLVETITGVQTVKAGALEPMMAKRWDDQLAAYVSAAFRSQITATVGHESIGLIGKLVTALTLWFGAQLVMAGELTLGMFIAFNMFAGRVAQPIMRMAQLWADFQQVGISMQRLGDILNAQTEVPPNVAAQLPSLKGHITFDQVSFRYNADASPVLREIRLDIAPGQVIGIVGRSGSGKSTLTKLVQRLYVPEQGRILIDNVDIAQVDAAQIRRQIGVVLQDNWMFNRTVRENIAVTNPAASMDQIMHAARLAGAHDFISELPQGYDTMVGEQGSSLSGGQRQRLAIARALFTNPRILIFDEATSALDYESEQILQRNMKAICHGRTVLIIAHRLSSVRHADGIVVLDKGRIVEGGTHDTLLSKKSLYAHLWAMQSGAPA
jgi:ATP-binding cassette, subfamily B, bacterial HlyB/CyaB